MRYVDRSIVEAPLVLTKEGRKGPNELKRAQDYFADSALGTEATKVKFGAYKDDEVKALLERLFHGKCAYCESIYASTAPVDIEHYRPKGGVEDDPTHPGYWWAAMRWSNLLPSCIDCNRRRYQPSPPRSASLEELQLAELERGREMQQSGKSTAFPIEGPYVSDEAEDDALAEEEPLLLDPTRTDPTDHLKYHIDRRNLIGLVLPERVDDGNGGAEPSLQGATSIQIYGLNRLGLVYERTRILRRLNLLQDVIAELSAVAEELAPPGVQPSDEDAVLAERLFQLVERLTDEIRAMAEPQEPYSEMVRAWIEKFKNQLGD
jgi:hypothetical protein